MNQTTEPALKFPCDCFTESKRCEEPWALIAKRGVFKGGTKEKILNLIHERPKTLAQLSKSLEVSQTTIHRHLNVLASGGLIAVTGIAKKNYPVERYYKPTFPVVTEKDQEEFGNLIEELAEDIVKSFSDRYETFKDLFEGSDAEGNGWTPEEIAQFILQAASRKVRRLLEENGNLAASLHGSKKGILFWATTE